MRVRVQLPSGAQISADSKESAFLLGGTWLNIFAAERFAAMCPVFCLYKILLLLAITFY